MKLDLNYMRDILIKLKNNEHSILPYEQNFFGLSEDETIDDATLDKFYHHINCLQELECVRNDAYELTFRGHLFLENINDNNIWDSIVNSDTPLAKFKETLL